MSQIGHFPTTPKSSNGGEPSCMFRTGVAIWLCSLLIVAGLLGITGAAVGLHSFAHLAESGAGIWCGLMFIAAGAVGIAAAQSMTVPLVKATVAMAVVAFILAIVLVVVAVLGLGGDLKDKDSGRCWMLCSNKSDCACRDESSKAVAANVLLIASAVIALIFALWLLIISSRSLRKFFESQAPGAQSGVQTIGVSPADKHQSIAGNQIGPYTPPGTISIHPDQPIIIVRQQGQPVTTYIHQSLPDGTIALHPDQPFVVVPPSGQPLTTRQRPGNPPPEQSPVG